MLNTYYTEKLLGLKEAILLNSYDSDDCKVIEINRKKISMHFNKSKKTPCFRHFTAKKLRNLMRVFFKVY